MSFFKKSALFLPFSLLLFVACQRAEQPHYIVGVSQCSDDAWRRKMNQEMYNEVIFHPEMQLHIRFAQDNSEIQCQQIDSFIAEGVDLLIVSPNEAEEVKPAVTRAYEKGIPIVVADRRVSGDQWTAFIGGDNEAVGTLMGDWLISLLQSGQLDEVRMLEIEGLPGSTPAVGRHHGMMQRIADEPRIKLLGSGMGSWFWKEGKQVTDSLLNLYPDINVIVAHNDQMAQGASEAAAKHGIRPFIMGVDAITGEGGGINAIIEGRMDVTATYSSRGDIVIRRAAQILAGEPFLRDTVLPTFLVNAETALTLQQQAETMDQNIRAISELNGSLMQMGNQYHMQRIVITGMIILIVLLVVYIITAWLVYQYRKRIRLERENRNALVKKQQEQLLQLTEQLAKTQAEQSEESKFIKRLEAEIEMRLSDPQLDVDSLGDKLGMSRTALYRKTKAATGYSPVELVRHIRLHKAQQLLRNTQLTVQQVAYETGFSAPSYFAKCYKEAFGINPKEESKNKTHNLEPLS